MGTPPIGLRPLSKGRVQPRGAAFLLSEDSLRPLRRAATVARTIQLSEPFTEDKIRALKMGHMVHLSGVIYTGRES
jgi:hypothetical protein